MDLLQNHGTIGSALSLQETGGFRSSSKTLICLEDFLYAFNMFPHMFDMKKKRMMCCQEKASPNIASQAGSKWLANYALNPSSVHCRYSANDHVNVQGFSALALNMMLYVECCPPICDLVSNFVTVLSVSFGMMCKIHCIICLSNRFNPPTGCMLFCIDSGSCGIFWFSFG